MANSKEIFSNNLKSLLIKNKISQSKICKDLNIKPTTFSGWITCKTYPRINNLEKISKYFNIPISNLIEGENNFDIYKKLNDIVFILENSGKDKKITFNGDCITNDVANIINTSLKNTIRLINDIVSYYTPQ